MAGSAHQRITSSARNRTDPDKLTPSVTPSAAASVNIHAAARKWSHPFRRADG